MASSDIRWPDLALPPVNLWSLARSFEPASRLPGRRLHPSFITRRLAGERLQLMQRLLTVRGEGHIGERV